MPLPERENPLWGKGGDSAYTVTAGGHKLYYARFNSSDIRFEDIAYGLSHICRWLGVLRRHYSVAEHSVHLARYALSCQKEQLPRQLQYDDEEVDSVVRKEFAKVLLFHDAEEYVTGDFPAPLKQFFNPLFEDYASYVREAIFIKYGVHYPYYKYAKEWDRKMLYTEAHHFLIGGVRPVTEHGTVAMTLGCPIFAWTADRSREEFNNMYLKLV